MDILDTVTKIEINISELNKFLENWDKRYSNKLQKIDLFNPGLTKKLSFQQKQLFVKIFYHLRGHFHDFLWYMGNHAPNVQAKKMILENIGEEFGLNGRSHEQLYFDFARSLDVNLSEEIATEQHYLPFARDFNRGHSEWLRNHNWDDNLIVFSAYERLDNIDYISLYNLAESFGLTKKDLVFFSVHKYVKHFDNTLDNLSSIWSENPTKIKEGFDFIASYQINMWEKLSDEIFNYHDSQKNICAN